MWLKRIFSVQSISLFIACISAYYAYKMYEDSRMSDVSIGIFNPETKELKDFNDTPYLFAFCSFREDDCIDFYSDDNKYGIIMPHIQNNTSKSLLNFKCLVSINTFKPFDLENEDYISDGEKPIFEIEDDIHSDYEKIDINPYKIDLRYKYDILNPQSALPLPLSFVCFDDMLFYKITISITYEGIVKPIDLTIQLLALNKNIGLSKEAVEYFLSFVYEVCIPDAQDENGEGYSLLMTDGDEFKFVKKFKVMTKEEFKNYPFNNIEDIVLND